MINLGSLLSYRWLKDAVYIFIHGMVKESKYCRDVMKKKLTKSL